MLKILLIMVLFVFGVLAQTSCQLTCVSPNKYSFVLDRCCATSFKQPGNRCTSGFIDPAGDGSCVI